MKPNGINAQWRLTQLDRGRDRAMSAPFISRSPLYVAGYFSALLGHLGTLLGFRHRTTRYRLGLSRNAGYIDGKANILVLNAYSFTVSPCPKLL